MNMFLGSGLNTSTRVVFAGWNPIRKLLRVVASVMVRASPAGQVTAAQPMAKRRRPQFGSFHLKRPSTVAGRSFRHFDFGHVHWREGLLEEGFE